MYDVIGVNLCYSKSRLNPQKNGLAGPYPSTYNLKNPTRNPNSNPNSANRYPHHK